MALAPNKRVETDRLKKAKSAANDKLSSNVKSIDTKQLIAIEIDRRGWNKIGAAERLGVSRGTLYNALDGKISPKMARALAKVFGRTTEFWRQSKAFATPDELKVHTAPNLLLTHSSEAYNESECDSGPVIYGSPSSVLTDFMIEQAVRNKEIEIDPYNGQNKRSLSYDMRVGAVTYQVQDESTNTVFERDYDWAQQGFSLQPGQAVRITTLEKITLPLNYYARLGSIAEHVQKYLDYSIGLQVDPGFSGNLSFVIRNWGFTPFPIWQGQRILSIEIHRLKQAPEQGVSFYTQLGDCAAIFDDITEKFDNILWQHFNLEPTESGQQLAALPNHSVKLEATEDDIRHLCLTDLKAKALADDPTVQRYIDLSLGVLGLTISEVNSLLTEWDIKHDPNTGEFKTPSGDSGHIPLPEDGAELNLQVFAAFLRIPMHRISDALLHKTSWASVLTPPR